MCFLGTVFLSLNLSSLWMAVIINAEWWILSLSSAMCIFLSIQCTISWFVASNITGKILRKENCKWYIKFMDG